MVITYYGLSCFKVQSGDQTIIFDPPSKDSDLKPPRFETHVALSSHNHPLHNGIKDLPGKKESGPFLISGPGEYEIEDLSVTGLNSFHDSSQGKERGRNTIYVVEMENMRLCHLGDFGEKELSAENIEAMGEIDVLFVPVGGKDVIDPEEAVKIISELEPKIAIPMHYAISKTPIKGAKIEEFLKEWGEEKISPEDKFTFKKKDLPEDGTKLMVLSPTISIS